MKKVYENPSMLIVDLGEDLKTVLEASEEGSGMTDDLG